MGYYINQTQNGHTGVRFEEKCASLITAGAKVIESPDGFVEGMICVVDNGPFAAAAYLYSEEEMGVFTHPSDKRPKRFFQWERAQEFAM